MIRFIKPWEPCPWWAGIAMYSADRAQYLIAPLGVNYLVAIASVLAMGLYRPWFLLAVARGETLARAESMRRRLERAEWELRMEKAKNRAAEVSESIRVSAEIHDRLARSSDSASLRRNDQ